MPAFFIEPAFSPCRGAAVGRAVLRRNCSSTFFRTQWRRVLLVSARGMAGQAEPQDAELQEYLRLCYEIRRHDAAYYADEPHSTVSDEFYDELVRKVALLEKNHAAWPTKYESPLRTVGQARPSVPTRFPQAQHAISMLSLSNTYSREEVRSFFHRIQKDIRNWRPDSPDALSFSATLKLDGVALSLLYDIQTGSLLRAVTRGDGTTGDVVTANVMHMKGLVQKLPVPFPLSRKGNGKELEIRGEAFMTKQDFVKLNKDRERAGLDPMANPRNATSGSLKQLDHETAEARPISYIPYELIDGSEFGLQTHSDSLGLLKALGFQSMPLECKPNATESDILHFLDVIEIARPQLPMDVDGVVIRVNSNQDYAVMGSTARFPRGSIAYKFAAAFADTCVKDILVQVSRAGVLTPVAVLEPVEVGGVTVTRATLHNFSEIDRLCVTIGSAVRVERSGDVIPKISCLLSPAQTSVAYEAPERCPACDAPVRFCDSECQLRCINRSSCPAQSEGRIIHFASKAAMDISGLGRRTVESLMAKNLIDSPADLYNLSVDDLIEQVELFKEKRARNLVNAIQESKISRPLWRVLVSLGAPGLGHVHAHALAQEITDHTDWNEVESLLKDSDRMSAIPGLAEKSASGIQTFMENPDVAHDLLSLRRAGVQAVTSTTRTRTNSVAEPNVTGKSFVLTGRFDVGRGAVEEGIRNRGGLVRSSLGKTTDFLVKGRADKVSSKEKSATKYGTTVLDVDQLEELLKNKLAI